MPPHSDAAYSFTLHTAYILYRLDEIENSLKNISRAEFLRSEKLVMNVLVQADIIYYFIKNIPPDFKRRYPDVPWDSITPITKSPETLPPAAAACAIAFESAPALKKALLREKTHLEISPVAGTIVSKRLQEAVR